jgi:hypothetical protein
LDEVAVVVGVELVDSNVDFTSRLVRAEGAERDIPDRDEISVVRVLKIARAQSLCGEDDFLTGPVHLPYAIRAIVRKSHRRAS